tara:strand:+ start:69 stop:458 length:390 start_codon:yes stop_codon:yes gene_type:complete
MRTLETIIAKSNEAKSLLADNGIVLGENILIKTYASSMEILTCTDSTLSTKVFGADVTVYGYRGYQDPSRKIELNCGTLGSHDNTCVASVSKIMTQHAIILQWNRFADIAEALMNVEESNDKLNNLKNN